MFSSFSKWLGQFFSMEGESYTVQHEHYQQAAGFIRQALEYDEKSSKINFIPHSNLPLLCNRGSRDGDVFVSTRYSGIRKIAQSSCRSEW